jgi:hypothetical protein
MVLVYSIPAVRNAWADTAVPTTDTVDPGNAYESAGWTQTNQPPPRQYFNFLLNQVGSAIRYFMQNGIVDWQAGELYQVGAIVVANNFVFQSLTNSNTGNAPPVAGASNANWAPLNGYVTAANLAGFVTTPQLNAALAPYAALASPTFTGVPIAPTAAPGTSNNQIATTSFASVAANAAAAAGIAAAATAQSNAEAFSSNAANLSSGTVANARLPNIANMPGVTIAADPGTTPSGSPGQMFFYY